MKKLAFLSFMSLAVVVSATPAPFATAQTPAQLSGAAAQSPRHSRLLPLQGGQNSRDLGGYATQDGHHVRWGKLFRSGSLYTFTPQDFAYLSRTGVQTVVDFRSSQERALEPSHWPEGTAPRTLSKDYEQQIGARMGERHGETVGARMAGPDFVKAYPGVLIRMNELYRRMFDELLADHAPLLFHCSGGRDRTGVAAALILTALDVPRETIIQDYLLSDRYYDLNRAGPARELWPDVTPETLQAIRANARASIEEVFKVIDGHEGGARGYLRTELGLDDLKIARLKALYTE